MSLARPDPFRPSDPGGSAPYLLTAAEGDPGPMVFASPHSGGITPDDMGFASGLTPTTLRSAEDVGVDRLVASGPGLGIPLISGRVSRAYVDLNRAAAELDPLLVADCPSAEPSAKVAAGFGVIPRRAGDGAVLYDRHLSLEEAAGRLARVHEPYHQTLGGLMHGARERHGVALLIDWHSMPSRAAGGGQGLRAGRGLDIILGDRHGAACRGAVSRRIRTLFQAQGWSVGLNTPYAGGYSTQTWGHPGDGFQAIQVELNRALYLDEVTLQPSADYRRFAAALDRVIAAMAAENWDR